MSSPYTSVVISDYNASPPSDDGSNVSENALKWSNHIDKIGDPLKTHAQAIDANVQSAFTAIYGTTPLEDDNSITPVDFSFLPGNVFRYGAVADSGSGIQGTDNAAAFQAAADSGHVIHGFDKGWFSCESTVFIIGGGSEAGGKTFIGSSGARIERYTDVSTPIFHFAGDQGYINGRGMICAARNFGGFTRGLILYGQDPNAADNTGATEVDTMHGIMKSFKVIGKTSNTGWDGSVAFYFESSARRRGTFISPAINSYYSAFSDLYASQFDYLYFGSTDFNGHTFKRCTGLNFGHASHWFNGSFNTFLGCFQEKPTAQDTTERGGWRWGNKDSGPEAVNKPCEGGAATLDIIAITKGNPTIIQTSAPHGESTGNLIKTDGIVDSGAGDLEAALNTNHYTLTSTGADTLTIPVDTSAVSATWSSGGVVNTDPYPILGARANHVVGDAEMQFDPSTMVVRMFLQDRPGGNADTEKIFRGKFGKNVMDLAGTFPGGIAKDGFSTPASILNNIVYSTNTVADYETPINYHGFQFRRLDDSSGDSFGTDEFKVYSDRMANLAESTAYNVIKIDNVGPTTACMNLMLTFAGKDSANADVHAGEISWLLPVTGGSEQTPIKYKDFQANENDENVTWSITATAGTDADTGKFQLVLTTGNPAGTGNFFYTWRVKLIPSELEGDTGLDWDADVTIQNGA